MTEPGLCFVSPLSLVYAAPKSHKSMPQISTPTIKGKRGCWCTEKATSPAAYPYQAT